MTTKRLGVLVSMCAVGILVLVSGCAGAEDDRPPAPSPVTNSGGSAGNAGSGSAGTGGRERPSRRECESGTVQECTIYLPAHGSVQPCYPGLSVCDAGRWTDCLSTEDAEDMLESMNDRHGNRGD